MSSTIPIDNALNQQGKDLWDLVPWFFL